MNQATHDKLSWYVVRTAPGAQRPDPRDPRFSRVELELTEKSFSCYMPIEVKDIIHHRTKKQIAKWFPLIPGYVFVQGVTDFEKLEKSRGVAETVRVQTRPIVLQQAEVDLIRLAEMAVFDELANSRVASMLASRRLSGRAMADVYPSGAQVMVKADGFLAGELGRIAATTGRQTVKIILDRLNNLGTIELSVDDISLIA